MILLLWFWDTDGMLSMTPARRKLMEQLAPKNHAPDDTVPFIHDEDGVDRTGDN